MQGALEDHYAALGVTREASAAELRRRFRRLALQLHPDRAGPASAPLFQRAVEAYRVLSDREARLAYDRSLRAAEEKTLAQMMEAAERPRDLIERLSGRIDRLLDRGVARRAPDGVIELVLLKAEAEAGGTAAVEVPAAVTCPTCAGVAGRNRVWCQRCEYAGTVVELLVVAARIPAGAYDGLGFVFPIDPTGLLDPLRVRIRIASV